jgi:hypothetical protein
VLVLALGAVVVATIPLVKGTLVAEETSAKATAWVVAVGIGVAVWLEGLSTLFKISIFCAKNSLQGGHKLTYQEHA